MTRLLPARLGVLLAGCALFGGCRPGSAPAPPMPPPDSPAVSAQVLIRSASGREVGPEAVVTAETLREFAPAPEDVAAATQGFRALGFETGAFVGISFSITGPAERFEEAFGVRLRRSDRRGIRTADGSDELPLDGLPDDLAALVTAVTFVPPPDFGPGAP